MCLRKMGAVILKAKRNSLSDSGCMGFIRTHSQRWDVYLHVVTLAGFLHAQVFHLWSYHHRTPYPSTLHVSVKAVPSPPPLLPAHRSMAPTQQVLLDP